MSERDVIADIKRYQPASLKVTLGDGTEKAVAVPKNRNRWSRTQQVLDAMQWIAIECLDKDGRVLGVIEDDEMADSLVEAGDGDAPGTVAMARVLTDVMRTTMKETRQMFEAQMRGNAELVQALIEGQRALQQSYEMSMQVQRAALVADATQNAGGNPEILTMMQLAMGMMNNKPQQPQIPAAKPPQGAKQ